MTIAKSVVTGTVFRAPEKRFTQNNVAVYSLILNIGDREEMLIRVLSTRTAMESVMESISKGDRILVEGRLQTANAKMEDGTERKIFEIDASTVEQMGAASATSAPAASAASAGEISKFAEEEFSEELIGEEEIPF